MKLFRRLPLAVVVIPIVLSTIGGLAILVATIGRFKVDFGDSTGSGTTRLSLVIIMIGGEVGVMIYTALITLGASDYRAGFPLSPLYWPFLMVAGCIMENVLLACTQAVDLMAHGLKPHWMALYRPGTRVIGNLFLLGTFAGLAWIVVVLLRGRAWSRQHIAYTFIYASLAASALIVGGVVFAVQGGI
jgi:hypothetical protein